MICQNCHNGILTPTLVKVRRITYRSFIKDLGTELYHECSNCLYEAIEPVRYEVNVDVEMEVFKREVNMKLSVGEDL